MNLSVNNFTRRNSPASELFLSKMAQEILGKDYSLSIVFIGDKRCRNINRTYRQKDYATNVLSFPLDKKSGEIFLNLRKVEQQTTQFEMPYKKLCIYLLIHGMLHLLGLDHGRKMDALEQKFLKKFS